MPVQINLCALINFPYKSAICFSGMLHEALSTGDFILQAFSIWEIASLFRKPYGQVLEEQAPAAFANG